MKIIAAILFFLILTGSFFYYGYFDAALFHSKEKAMKSIANAENRQSFMLFKISVKEKNKYADDEAWINGELYDVAERKVAGDSICLYLYHDTDEQNVLSEIGDFFKADDNSFTASSPGIPVLKSIRVIPNMQYILNKPDFLLLHNPASHKPFVDKNTVACSQVFDVPVPPPRIFFI